MKASRPAASAAIALGIALLLTTLAACGKKGPPLAPLHLVPVAVGELVARRSGDDVELRFSLPETNANGPGPIDLASIEIYAITIGQGADTPPNRDLLVKARVVGTIAVRPPPVEGESPAPGAPPDKRPGPGERVTFVDQLTAEKLKPIVLAKPAGKKPDVEGQKPDTLSVPVGQTPEPGGQKPGAGTLPPDSPGLVPSLPPAPAGAPYPTRIYAIRGLTRSGRPGLPSTRVVVPLVDPVAPPTAVVAQMPTETAVVVDWTPPVAELGGTPIAFNVYRREDLAAPLNATPLSEVKFETGTFEYGKEQCFVVRTVQALPSITLESVPSAPGCLTPLDKFPPAAPKGLRAVAEDGAVSLVWDQNAEADLGGYLVLRAEAPGDTLLPLMEQPIVDATYRDATVKPGVRYVYAVVAVDKVTPRNRSAQSVREEVTAR